MTKQYLSQAQYNALVTLLKQTDNAVRDCTYAWGQSPVEYRLTSTDGKSHVSLRRDGTIDALVKDESFYTHAARICTDDLAARGAEVAIDHLLGLCT